MVYKKAGRLHTCTSRRQPVDQTDVEGLLTVDGASCQDEVQGAGQTDQCRQTDRPTVYQSYTWKKPNIRVEFFEQMFPQYNPDRTNRSGVIFYSLYRSSDVYGCREIGTSSRSLYRSLEGNPLCLVSIEVYGEMDFSLLIIFTRIFTQVLSRI